MTSQNLLNIELPVMACRPFGIEQLRKQIQMYWQWLAKELILLKFESTCNAFNQENVFEMLYAEFRPFCSDPGVLTEIWFDRMGMKSSKTWIVTVPDNHWWNIWQKS